MKRGKDSHGQIIPKIAFKGMSCSSFLWNTYVGCQHAQSLQRMNYFSLSPLAAYCSNAWMLALPPAQHGLQSPHMALLSDTGIPTFLPEKWLAGSLKNSPWRSEKFWGSLASDSHKQQHLTSRIQLPRLGYTVVGRGKGSCCGGCRIPACSCLIAKEHFTSPAICAWER